MIWAFAPAKINLALHVTGRRDDGYHLLDSLVVFAGIGDALTFAPSDDRTLTVTGPFAQGVPTGPENLIWKAADLIDPAGTVAITLDKQLPHGAGIGGGSSDAAATLRSLSTLWEVPLPSPEAALSLGADVPACLRGRPLRMSGIGEVLSEPASACTSGILATFGLLLVNPSVPMPTAAAFRALASAENSPLAPIDWTDQASFLDWMADQRNDLETPSLALAPAIGDALMELRDDMTCRLARMSGSGATCFGLFDTIEAAMDAEAALSARRPDWWVRAAPILR